MPVRASGVNVDQAPAATEIRRQRRSGLVRQGQLIALALARARRAVPGLSLPTLALSHARMRKLQALLPQHVAQAGEAGFQCLPDLGLAAVELRPDIVAVHLQADVDGAKMLRHHADLGLADALPVPDASVDLAHARWAYFFGPGGEPGLAELDRVMRRGGVAFVIDNDAERSTFGNWFRQGFPEVSASDVERFWSLHGWSRERLQCAWTFDTREDLDAVVRIELPTATAERVLSSYDGGLEIDYAINLWWRRF